MHTILIVEDDHSIRTAMVDLMEGMGYEVLSASNGPDGLRLALERNYHLLLLDLVLPSLSGFDILQELKKQKPGQAVIILSARGQEDDRIKGLKLGADDYCVKPFSVKELLARVDAVLRRTYERKGIAESVRLGLSVLSVGELKVCESGESIPLGEKEYGLLNYLYQNQGRLVAKEELLQNIWNVKPELTGSRTVEMHIANLRKKLPADLEVKTTRGLGYQLIINSGA